jgi:hypothetical protein
MLDVEAALARAEAAAGAIPQQAAIAAACRVGLYDPVLGEAAVDAGNVAILSGGRPGLHRSPDRIGENLEPVQQRRRHESECRR